MLKGNPLIVANWKMNGSIEFAKDYCAALEHLYAHDKQNADIVICSNNLILPFLRSEYFESGAQDLSYLDPISGSFTGEVSASQIYDVGASFVLIGHSERRTYFKESNEMLKAKIENALKAGLKPIFCVGEPLEIREQGGETAYVEEQLDIVVNLKDVIIAYEPVWSIGGTKTPEMNEIEEMHKFIKSIKPAKVIYGGSVSSKNSEAICSLPSVDGLLVGRASLDYTEFWNLVCNGVGSSG